MQVRYELFDAFPSLVYVVSHKDTNLPLEGSMALHTGQDPQTIRQNRERLVQHAGMASMHIVLAQQTHSAHVEVVTRKETRGWYAEKDAIPACDALVTDIEGLAVGVLTADCVPILLFDPRMRVVAAVHAGWRGTHQHILARTIRVMRQRFASSPSDIRAAIGPSIRACCYEVGDEVASCFVEYPDALIKDNTKQNVDLATVNRLQLIDEGVREAHIHVDPTCTSCMCEDFFSYRAQRCDGRFLSLIALKPSRV